MGNMMGHKATISPKLKFYDIEFKDIDGRSKTMSEYRSKVLVIVNTASNCGMTKQQFKELNDLRNKYSSRGFEILAFPCSQFGNQELKKNDEIKAFAQKSGVSFPIMEKVTVNGANSHALFQYLKLHSKKFGTAKRLGGIGWNYGKFVVDRNGEVAAYFVPKTKPMKMEEEIVKLLNKEDYKGGFSLEGGGDGILSCC